MTQVIGPDTDVMFHLINDVRRMSTAQIDAVIDAWRHRPAAERVQARAAALRAASPDQRYEINAAAATARNAAMVAASLQGRVDWAFWSAVDDGAAAVAASGLIDDRGFEELIGPLAQVLPWVGRRAHHGAELSSKQPETLGG
jgi:hypothetical protein